MGHVRFYSILGFYSTPRINFIPSTRLKTSAENWQKTCSEKSLDTVSLYGLWWNNLKSVRIRINLQIQLDKLSNIYFLKLKDNTVHKENKWQIFYMVLYKCLLLFKMFIGSKMTVLHYFLWRITVCALIYGITVLLKILKLQIHHYLALVASIHSGWGYNY